MPLRFGALSTMSVKTRISGCFLPSSIRPTRFECDGGTFLKNTTRDDRNCTSQVIGISPKLSRMDVNRHLRNTSSLSVALESWDRHSLQRLRVTADCASFERRIAVRSLTGLSGLITASTYLVAFDQLSSGWMVPPDETDNL